MRLYFALLSLAAHSRLAAAARRGDPRAFVGRQLPQSNITTTPILSSQTPALIPDASTDALAPTTTLTGDDGKNSAASIPALTVLPSTSEPRSSPVLDLPAPPTLDGAAGLPTEGEGGGSEPAKSTSSTSDEMILQFFGDPGAGGVTTITTPRTEAPRTSSSLPGLSDTSRANVPSALPAPSSSIPRPTQVSVTHLSFTTLFKPKTTLTRSPAQQWNGTLSLRTSYNGTQEFTRYSVSTTEKEPPSTAKDNSSPQQSEEGSPFCIPESPDTDPTTYSIIYTETTTFYGEPSDYTAPYPPITTPATCKFNEIEGAKSRASYQFTLVCSTVKGVESCVSETVFPGPTIVMTEESTTSPKFAPSATKTITFMTTEKNPSVVYSPVSTPGYGHDTTTEDGPREGRPHPTAPQASELPTNIQIPNSHVPQSMKEQPTSSIVITAAPSRVIIGDETFTDLGPSKTTVVTVGRDTFTINPSQVVGGGSTIERPVPPGGVFIPGSTTTVGGIQVIVAPSGLTSVAVIDSTTFTIGPKATTTVIKGQVVTVGPNGIVFPSQTVPVAEVLQTEVVVAGGDMVTAIGQSVVVIRSTTITYGPGITPITEIIDDDTIIIGPSGVVVHSTTIGGPNAKPSDVAIEIVGGATITQIGPSVVVIGGSTYTVGPGTGKTTTVIGGETITIGPEGVSVSTLNFPFPFGPTIVTTIKPSATATIDAPAETSSKNGAGASGPRWETVLNIGFCIAIGVWVLGYMS